VCSAKTAGRFKLVIEQIDRDYLAGAGDAGALDNRRTNTPSTENCD
jgi:hypothetical protein